MLLFFDDPDDPCIARYSDHPRLTVVPCDADRWAPDGGRPTAHENRQVRNASLGLRMAAARGARWLAHIDVDELLDARVDLNAWLDRLPPEVDSVNVQPFEAIPEPGVPAPDLVWFKRTGLLEWADHFVSHGSNWWCGKLRRRTPPGSYLVTPSDLQALPRAQRRLDAAYAALVAARGPERAAPIAFMGHRQGKAIVRINLDRVRAVDAHRPMPHKGVALRIAFTDAIRLRHYYCAGFDDWARKWRRRVRDGWPRTGGDRRAAKMARARALFTTDDDAELHRRYARLHHVDATTLAHARALGLVVGPWDPIAHHTVSRRP